MPDSPLPIRDGLNPTRLRLPRDAPEATVAAYLSSRFPSDVTRIAEKIESGEVRMGDGTVVTPTTAYTAGAFVFLYRDPPAETRVPFEVDILHRDDDVLVVDKPHFLATTPRGGWVTETALVRLRRNLDLPELSPAHRLDRLTAGVLLFTVRREARRPYQMLFADRLVTKEYEAVAPYPPSLDLPAEISSRIIKERGVLQAREEPGEPNAHTCLDLLDDDNGTGLYRLRPTTGKTHQLRVHMNSVGTPILHDPLYPEVHPGTHDDYSRPLQLLARMIEFDDPITGRRRCFRSRRNLAAWKNSASDSNDVV